MRNLYQHAVDCPSGSTVEVMQSVYTHVCFEEIHVCTFAIIHECHVTAA